MILFIDGVLITNNLNIPATTTIGTLKTYFGTIAKQYNLKDYEIRLFFRNKQELSPIVWTTDQYDDVDFQQYANVLKGGQIIFTSVDRAPTFVNVVIGPPQPQHEERLTTDAQKRDYLFAQIIESMPIWNHERIMYPYHEYTEYKEEFPSHEAFRRRQRMLLDNANTDKLDHLLFLMRNIKNRKVDYVDMENAVPRQAPDGFFLINDKIVMVAQR